MDSSSFRPDELAVTLYKAGAATTTSQARFDISANRRHSYTIHHPVRMTMSELSNFFVAVTGAQGVGKSTFCRRLQQRLEEDSKRRVVLLDGLGERIRLLGIPLGSASTAKTIAAVFTAHLEREVSAPSGLIVLDRCVIDALAYTRALGVSSEVEVRLYNQVAALAAQRLGFVVHLRLSSFFENTGAPHETPILRASVAEKTAGILAELGLPHISLDAVSADAVDRATSIILEQLT